MGLTYDPENRPEASNLLNIYAALADLPRAEVEARFADSARPSRASSPSSRSTSSRRSPPRCVA